MLPMLVTLTATMLVGLGGLLWRFSALVARFEATAREHEKMRSEFPRMAQRMAILEERARPKTGGDFG